MVVDKEAGWTSHDVVARCRRIFGQQRVGHAGTLDPDATGVLLVGLGRATRLMRFLTALPKTYEAEVVLGTATSTLDASGEVTGTWDMDGVSLAEVREAAAGLTGDIEQVPPMVSAVKVGGRRLHALAREGIEVERAARPGHRLPLRRRPRARRPACSASRWSARRAPMSGCWRPTSARRSAAAPTCATCGGRGSGRSPPRTPAGRRARPRRSCSPRPRRMRDLDQVVVPDATPSGSWPGACRSTGCPSGSPATAPGALVDDAHHLLAVYEATETDRIKPAVVVESAG